MVISVKIMGIIRFLLAFSVVIFHSAPLLGLGFMDGIVAVKGFFMISGFYMALILNEKYIDKNNSYKLFISNRLLRIYPMYWVMLVLTILVGYFWAFHGAQLQTLIPNNYHPTNFFLYTSPLGMLRDFSLIIRSDYINPQNLKLPLVAPAWTLVLEILFYLIAPFLIKRKWWLILLLLIVSFCIRYFLYFTHYFRNEYLLTGFFPASIGYFLIGLLSYRLYGYLKKRIVPSKISQIILLILSCYIIFWDRLPAITIYTVSVKEIMFFPILFFSVPFIFLFSQASLIDGFLADLSYPIYISHWFIFSLIWNVFSFTARTTEFVVLFIVGTVILAILLKILVDTPINKLRQSRVK